MRTFRAATLFATCLTLFASLGFADGRNAGSALIFPLNRSGLTPRPELNGAVFLTVVSVTNTNLSPLSGSTNVQFDYVNTLYNSDDSCLPLACTVVDRVEALTAADTLSVLTACHNVGGTQEGYLVVHAQDPTKFKTAWSFNHLMGSQIVVGSTGLVFSVNAIPFESPVAEFGETDLDLDDQLDFDGAEYEGVPDELYLERFLAQQKTSILLINLTGGTAFVATIKFDAFNDNEFPLSATKQFRCWMTERLQDISLIFTQDFLLTTPHDPGELDVNCNGVGGLETGWTRITGTVANSTVESIPDPALVGYGCVFAGVNLLWESEDLQFNGDFLKFGTDDPEH